MLFFWMKKFIVHRCGMKDGGTQHWFSWPVSKRKAKKICKRWVDIDYIPVNSEYDFTGADPHNFTLDSLVYLHVDEII